MFQLPCQTALRKIAVYLSRASAVFVAFLGHTFDFGIHPSLDSPKTV
jgi:hypothetical protein